MNKDAVETEANIIEYCRKHDTAIVPLWRLVYGYPGSLHELQDNVKTLLDLGRLSLMFKSTDKVKDAIYLVVESGLLRDDDGKQ